VYQIAQQKIETAAASPLLTGAQREHRGDADGHFDVL
jgi:hypothetical protein